MSYAHAGRVWTGAITALSLVAGEPTVTGGSELTSIAGQTVFARFGMRIEVEKDDLNYGTTLVEDRERYPQVILPFRGASRDDFTKVLGPLRHGSYKLRRRALEGLARLPGTGLLVIPDDPAKDNFLYCPKASLGPESTDLLHWNEIDPIVIEDVEFVPNEGAAGEDIVQGTLAEVAAAIAAEVAAGGGLT